MTQREMNGFIFFLPTVKVASCPLAVEKQAGHMPRDRKGDGGQLGFFVFSEGTGVPYFSPPVSTERRMSKEGPIKPCRQIGFE